MQTTETRIQKSIVDELNFGKKTVKRVAWESREFTIVGPYQVKVTNTSFDHLKDDDAYVVGVEVRNGRAVPAECECPADMYFEDYDCKQKVALAMVGDQIVIKASANFLRPKENSDRFNLLRLSDKFTSNRKSETEDISEESKPPDVGNHNNCECANHHDDFLCWPHSKDGIQDLPRQLKTRS